MALYDIDGRLLAEDVEIKSYYENEMEDTIAKTREIITEPALVFPVVTDIHRYSTGIRQSFEDMIHNIKHFANKVKCDFVANTGDTIDGNLTQAASLEQAYESMSDFLDIGIPILYAQGNHDNNPYDSNGSFGGNDFTVQQVFKGFFTDTKGVTYNFGENGTDYYIDFPVGVRVIVLNACNVKKAHNYAYGDTTASWLSAALDTDRTVIALSHLSPIASQVWNNCHGPNADAVASAFTTFVNGGGKLIHVSGHSHIDIAFIKPWLSVVNTCQKFEMSTPTSEGHQKISGYINVLAATDRTANTYTEDAWTVCVLKPNSQELDCIRFGSGYDRYFHYNAIAPTTLTSRLEGVTWSSSDTSVATVSNGVVTGVASGTCGILAKDSEGNYEAWTIIVA